MIIYPNLEANKIRAFLSIGCNIRQRSNTRISLAYFWKNLIVVVLFGRRNLGQTRELISQLGWRMDQYW